MGTVTPGGVTWVAPGEAAVARRPWRGGRGEAAVAWRYGGGVAWQQ
ncbi:hypothetical protein [Lentzea sp. NEAU-D7]|nr:hypothetical protein [Lentzea sp. NEAU-D7]MCX2948649.1 hypothetical protein [Lentzea sp. NEAU-D7]MCX2951207.1 hypothetical protein [Lentzea sp. NEAU-D7]